MQLEKTRTLSWRTDRDCQILFADYRSLVLEELVAAIKENEEVVNALQEQGMRDLLILSDVTGAPVDKHVVTAFMSVSKAMKPITRASAVVGVDTPKKVILSVVNAFSSVPNKALDSLDEAMDWLVEQQG
jgi:hypothetical protein